jgi:LysM repeat protein
MGMASNGTGQPRPEGSQGAASRSSLLRQVAIGLVVVSIVLCTVVCSSMLTLQEGRSRIAAEPTETPTIVLVLPPTRTPTQVPPSPTATPTEVPPTATSTPTPQPTLTSTSTPTPVPTPTQSPSPTQPPSPTATAQPTPTRLCIVPSTWRLYTVQPGDTLTSLAVRYGTTVSAIVDANCLSSTGIYAGQRLYLPAQPVVTPIPPATPIPPTPTTPACVPNPPASWVWYAVQNDDNLYNLAQSRKTTVSMIQSVNCLQGYVLALGQQIYLPPELPTPTPTWTSVPTMTPAPPTPTWTPTATLAPVPTASPTPTVDPPPDPPTATPTVTSTPTTAPGG